MGFFDFLKVMRTQPEAGQRLSELEIAVKNPDAATLGLVVKRLAHYSTSLRNLEYMTHLVNPLAHHEIGKCSLNILEKDAEAFPATHLYHFLNSEHQNDRADFVKLSKSNIDSHLIQYLLRKAREMRFEFEMVKSFVQENSSFTAMLKTSPELAIAYAIASNTLDQSIASLNEPELEVLRDFSYQKSMVLKNDLAQLDDKSFIPAGETAHRFKANFEAIIKHYQAIHGECHNRLSLSLPFIDFTYQKS